MRIEPEQIVNGGTYTENVENHGTIKGGVFTGKVDSFGGIEGGKFKGEVEVHPHSSISGGKFSGFVHVQPNASVNNGEFLGFVKVNGTIKNGKFLNNVELFGGIKGGEYFGTVSAFGGSEISDGIFQGEVDLYAKVKLGDNQKIYGPLYTIVTNPISGRVISKDLVEPGVANPIDEIRKNNDYPSKIEKAIKKIIEEKNSYLSDQNDKNPLDLLALSQDFNDNIL